MAFRISIFLIIGLFTLFVHTASQAAVSEDALGRVIHLPKTPERIVSLAPSLTEILFYLGLGDRVVGVTQFSYFPPEAAHKPKVGSYINLNVEKIISLDPDLIIGTLDGNEEGEVRLLEQAGETVFLVNPRTVQDTIKVITDIGDLCGIGKRAGELASSLERRVDYVVKKTSSLRKPLVFLQINIKPIMTVNKNTFHHDVIRLAGGINMAQDESITYPRISIEEILIRKPEVIIISSMERGGSFEEARQEWLRWSGLPASEKKQIYLIDSDLIDRSSPRIVDGLEAMGRVIHPEAGWEASDD